MNIPRQRSYFTFFALIVTVCLVYFGVSRIYTVNIHVKEENPNVQRSSGSSTKLPAKEENPNAQRSSESARQLPVLPSPEELKTKSDSELEDLYHGFMNQTQVKCNKIVRIGSRGDGGWYVCLDNEYYPVKPCLVYSFGIDTDSSFDVGMQDVFGCEVHSFDPFVKKEKVPNLKLLNFHAIGLSDKTGIVNGREFMTLLDTRKHLNHTNTDISILKMDIEWSEWDSLKKAMSDGELDHVKQIPLEFHSPVTGAQFFRNALNVIKKLMDLNFRVYLVDRNNACKYVNSRKIQLTQCYNVYMIKVS